MDQRPAQNGDILSKAVPVGLYEETDANMNHKLGAAHIRLVIEIYKHDIENELRRWLAEDVPRLWPPADKATREQSCAYLGRLVKPLIECVSRVAELKGRRRVDYLRWLFTHRVGNGFAFNRGGITGIILDRANIGQWLTRHGHQLDSGSVSNSVLIPFLEILERLLWQKVHYYYVNQYGEAFFLDRDSYSTLISTGGF